MEEKPLLLSGKSAFLFGTDAEVCNFTIVDESIATQHCVIQFRERFQQRELTYEEQIARGDMQTVVTERSVKPFIMDLETEYGTKMNGEAVEPARYYEILDKDVINLGGSEV